MTAPRFFLFLIAALVAHIASAATPQQEAAQRGRQFLADLMNKDLELLPEFAGSPVYWISHDNYLAAKTIEKSHPDVARTIFKAIEREGSVPSDGKMELLFGKNVNVLPFRHFDLVDVRRVGTNVIKNEVATDRLLTGWEKYVDLLFYAAMAESDPATAQGYWDVAMKGWDGKGFVDPVFDRQKIYATYKLGLAAIASKRPSLKAKLPDNLTERLMALQADSGGWITDYAANGKRLGKSNVETTCLAILALDGMSGDAP
jgi:hypothetical protein